MPCPSYMPCPSRISRRPRSGDHLQNRHDVSCPYGRLHRALAMDTTQSRLWNVSPTLPALPAAHLPRRNLCASPTPSFPDAAASPTGTSCCTPPYPPLAAPAPHSANFDFRFSSWELRNAKRETRRQSCLPQSALFPPLSPLDKTAPPH